MKSAIIIGNGLSRKNFDLNEICKNAITFGCNASYREFKSDFLVAIDEKIINEILESTYPLERFLVPSKNDQYEPAEFNPNRPRENTGMVAINYAIKMGFDQIILLGFDFMLGNKESLTSNMFEGSPGYGPETKASEEDCLRRRNYFKWMIDRNLKTKFTLLYPESVGENYAKNIIDGCSNLNVVFMQGY